MTRETDTEKAIRIHELHCNRLDELRRRGPCRCPWCQLWRRFVTRGIIKPNRKERHEPKRS